MAHRSGLHPWAPLSRHRLIIGHIWRRNHYHCRATPLPPSAPAHRHTATGATHPFCILLPHNAQGWRSWSCWSEAGRHTPTPVVLCARALAAPSTAVLWAHAPGTHTQTQPEALALRPVRRPQQVSTAPATPSSRPDPPMARPDPRGHAFCTTPFGAPEARA